MLAPGQIPIVSYFGIAPEWKRQRTTTNRAERIGLGMNVCCATRPVIFLVFLSSPPHPASLS